MEFIGLMGKMTMHLTGSLFIWIFLLSSRLFFDLKFYIVQRCSASAPVFTWTLGRAVYLTLACDLWYLFALHPFKSN